MASNLIRVFRTFPKEIFRVNNGRTVQVRAWTPRRHVYDIFAPDGVVEPKALDTATYEAPNGASMRPNSRYQQTLVSWRFKGDEVLVYAVPEGTCTTLPEDLLLVHERTDHYSLQPAKIMTLEELNRHITRFLMGHARAFTREQWHEAYPKSTE